MTSFKCPQCNLTNWATVAECKRCRLVFRTTADENQTTQNTFGEQSSGYQESNARQPPPFQNEWQQNQPAYNFQPPNYQHNRSADLKSGLAIASLVLGILGFVTSIILVGVLFAPIGLILGIVALVKANRKPQIYGGKGFAIAGIAASAITALFVPVILAIAIPNLLAARRAANEGSAISSLRTLAGAEEILMNVNGNQSCGDLRTLGSKQLIDSVLANGEKSGYRFTIVDLPIIGGGCEIHAIPSVSSGGVSSTGTRSFYFSTEDGVIRAANKNGKFADKTAPPLGTGQFDYPNQPPKIAVR